jgi:signal transduction histidine kinase
MTETRLPRGRARRLLILLFVVTVPPAVTLAWLGLRILQQDRDLAMRHALERREAALQAVVRSLEQSWALATRALDQDPVPAGMARLVITERGMEALPAGRLLWTPARTPAWPTTTDPRLQPIERLEFQGARADAVAGYQALLESSDAQLRVAVLIALGRMYQQERKWNDALRVYRELATIDGVTMAGAPADLHARRQIGDVLADARRGDDLRREAAALERDLLAGRWSLDAIAWTLTVRDIERWTGQPVHVDEERRLFSAAADLLWRRPRLASATETPAHGALRVNGSLSTIFVRETTERLTAIVVSANTIEDWIASAARGLPGSSSVTLVADDGSVIGGPSAAASPGALMAYTGETRLPWSVRLDYDNASAPTAELAGRTPLLVTGLGAMLVLLAGGGYMLWRVTRQEMAINRLQTEFVSAVSHEFRSPLTSLRHATELLNEHDDLPSERRRTFYRAMNHDTRRLQRLVESLLDFSRMEAGRKAYDMRPVSAAVFVRDVVDEFRASLGARGAAIELSIEEEPGLDIRADVSSLGHALWNLLDNAVKYSEGRGTVRVSVRTSEGGVAILVEDSGPGIPVHERQEIFGRFVRGSRALALGIPGTGLGLAMVSHIVSAHGGTVRVESEEGRGSTFTIWLPCDANASDAGRREQTPGRIWRAS